MSYEEKFSRARTTLISKCKKRISDNWEQMFDMWLSCEVDIQEIYVDVFKNEFSQYIDDTIKDKIFFAGSNVIFAIGAFMNFKKNASLKNVLNFVESFIETQMDDFDNWCEEISSRMYEETSEYEREFGEREENPA